MVDSRLGFLLGMVFVVLAIAGCVTPELCRVERLAGTYAKQGDALQRLNLLNDGSYREEYLADGQPGSIVSPKLSQRDAGRWEIKDTFVILHSSEAQRVDRWLLINRSLDGVSLRACAGENILYKILSHF